MLKFVRINSHQMEKRKHFFFLFKFSNSFVSDFPRIVWVSVVHPMRVYQLGVFHSILRENNTIFLIYFIAYTFACLRFLLFLNLFYSFSYFWCTWFTYCYQLIFNFYSTLLQLKMKINYWRTFRLMFVGVWGEVLHWHRQNLVILI